MVGTALTLDFRNCDPESVSSVITKTLQEVCVDSAVFDVDSIFLARKDTLFQCHENSVMDFAGSILKSIEVNLRMLLCRRCTLYVVPRFIVTSFQLEADSLHVIAKNDRAAWQALIEKGYNFDGWSPEHPILGFRDDRTFAPSENFECILVAEDHGTQKGSRFNSILRFRKVLTVLYCIASERSAYPLQKAMARPSEFCIQFPHKSGGHGQITRSDCGALTPYFAGDVQIKPADVAAIVGWYEDYSACAEVAQSRIDKGVHFFNLALNAEGIESYINYFVTLDALFGQRGAVESSILEGVKSLGLDPKFEEKTSWLFNLRNELVHGGSRYIPEWSDYSRYTQHFCTKPSADICALAQAAVLNAPRVLKT